MQRTKPSPSSIPVRKPSSPEYPPVKDPWPLLSKPGATIPPVPAMNRPPTRHVPEATPLLIGFTRNWPQLLQCVASYVAAGWPPEDIWVVENTGVMQANRKGRLTLQNPFYLNHTQLAMLGVNVLVTPTLLTFAQLQNFYAWTALERDWTEYFWSHQDLLVFSFENQTATDGTSYFSSAASTSGSAAPYGSIYARCLAVLRHLQQPGIPRWSNHFFAYDHLTLVHRDAILDVGGWDTHIPFYASDCDMYDRLLWAGYWQGEFPAGVVLDVGAVLDDIGALFRVPGVHASFEGDPGLSLDFEDDEDGATGDSELERQRKQGVDLGGEPWTHLIQVGTRMELDKLADLGSYRNSWQVRQGGGQGEPFYRDADGFDRGIQMLIDTGRRTFAEKWGHRGCDILGRGLRPEDAWRLEPDWDPQIEGDALEGGGW